MANIKFSDFTVGNTEGDIDFVVGYKGASNIQISPTNLLASALGNYLPLAGGTMTGDLKLNDNIQAQFGSSADLQIYHDTTDTWLDNLTGNLNIRNQQNSGDIIFRSDNGNGGVAEYFRVDGGAERNIFSKDTEHGDNISGYFGSGNNMRIFYNGSHSFISQNVGGDLRIVTNVDDGDIKFQADDGSGGIATYFYLDGSLVNGTSVKGATRFPDASKIYLGTGGDLEIFHNGSQTYIENYTGTFNITQHLNDGDIIFKSDDGSGGVTEYFKLDGSAVVTRVAKSFLFEDNVKSLYGTSGDFELYYDGTDAYLDNYNGNINIVNRSNDKDILFQSDDGSGGTGVYFLLDGSLADGSNKFTRFLDRSRACFGDAADLQIFHNGTSSYIENATNDLLITNYANDGDIKFFNDDGSGGVTEYFRVDGGSENVQFAKSIFLYDNIFLNIGGSFDLRLYHDGNSNIKAQGSGNLIISQTVDDSDIVFQCDDGSGGVTTYFQLDGSHSKMIAYKDIHFEDNIKARFGDYATADLEIYHNASDSVIENNTGHLFITNGSNDGDIVFKSDDGSGGTATYFALDGGITRTVVYKNFNFQDNVKLEMGTGADLQIYHDGSHSYIKDTGTGVLKLLGSGVTIQNAAGSENMAVFTENDTVILYNNGVEKLRTIGSGVKISGVSEYADNTAAIAGGLTTGDVYRTGDLLKIVH